MTFDGPHHQLIIPAKAGIHGGYGSRLSPGRQKFPASCITETAGGIRVISFRRANAREARRYEQEQAGTQTADR